MQLTDQFSRYNAEMNESLTHAIATSDTSLLTSIFREWDVMPPSFLDTTKTVISALQDKLSVKFSAQNVSVMEAASQLAAIENKNPYHGNTHFLKVFTLSAFLGAHAHRDGRMDAHQLSLLLSSALIHDLNHDGTNNKGEQYRLENIALNAAEQPLKQAGATEQDWQLIKAFVHTTDVSKNFADPQAVSPSESVKTFSLTQHPDDLFPELRILAETGTVDVALTLEDADLGGGLLDAELCKSSGMALAEEQGKEYDVKGQTFFLEHICHRRMFSISGQQLIQPHMNNVMTHFGLRGTSPDHSLEHVMK